MPDKIRPYRILAATTVIVPLFLFAVVMWQDYRDVQRETRREATRVAEIFEHHARSVFETHHLVCERVNERLQGMSWDEIGKSVAIRNYLKKISEDYPQVRAIWLADASGIVRNAGEPLPASPVSVADRDYFQALRKPGTELFIGNIVEARVIKGLNFHIAHRRETKEGKFDGVVVVTVLPEYFSDFWNKAIQKKNVIAILIRDDGMILARAPRLDPSIPKLPPTSSTMKEIRGKEKGSYFGISTHDGSKRLYAFRKLGRYNVYMVYGIGTQAVFNEWRRHIVFYGSIFGIATLALLVLALTALKRARREQEAKEDLNRAYAEMESRVHERTAELNRAIEELSDEISERRRAEEALHRLNRELRAISNCNQVLVRAEDEQTLLDEICRIICDEAGYRMAWVGYAENDEARTVRPAAWAGAEEGYLADAKITWADTDSGQGPSGTAIRTGKADCIQDFMTEQRAAPWREKALQRGYRSSIALPLKGKSENVYGVLNIYSTETNAFTPDEIWLMEELSVDLAFGITVLRDRIEHRRAQETIRKAGKYNRSLIEASLDPLVTIGPDGRITDLNAATETLTGHSREELIGTDFSDYFTEPGKAREGYRLAFQEGFVRDHPLEIRSREGRITSVLYNASVYRDEEGLVQGVFAAARDITKRKQAEEEVRKAGAYNRSLIEASLDPLVTIGQDGRITDVNAATENLTGYPREQLIGTDFSDYFTEPEKARGGYRQAFQEGFVRDYPLEIRSREGVLTSVLYDASVYRDENGQVLGVFAAARDITARKQAEEKIRKLNADLEQRVKDRTAELAAKNAQLEKVNRLFVGRELQMIRLKEKIKELEKALEECENQ